MNVLLKRWDQRLQAQIDALSAGTLITVGPPLSLAGGLVTLGEIDDAIHGDRIGGALHAVASGSAAGFMSAADYTKLAAYSGSLAGSNSGDVTLGTANGLSLVAQVLSMALAGAAATGTVSASSQTFGGDKTFNGATTFASSATVNGLLTVARSGSGLVVGELRNTHAAGYSAVIFQDAATGANQLMVGFGNPSVSAGAPWAGNSFIELITGTLKFINGTTQIASLSTAGLFTTTTLAVTGAATVGGNLTVETTTFVVDTSTNRIGLGTASPTRAIHLTHAGGADTGLAHIQNTDANGYSVFGFVNSGGTNQLSVGVANASVTDTAMAGKAMLQVSSGDFVITTGTGPSTARMTLSSAGLWAWDTDVFGISSASDYVSIGPSPGFSSISSATTTSGGGKLHIVVTDPANYHVMVLDSYSGASGTAASTVFSMRAARNTIASPAAVGADDNLGGFTANGWHSGGAYAASGKALVVAKAAEAWTSTAQGTYIIFHITPIGTTARAEMGRFSSNGAFRLTVQAQPATGVVGDLYMAAGGVLKVCTVAGTPGTWVSVGTQV